MRKVLIIDDSAFIRAQLTNILRDGNYKVVGAASNWDSGLKIIAEKQPDIITLDMILPTASGLDILKIIRREFPQIIVIMISAVGNNVIVEESFREGASDYIVKPFDESKVLETIGKYNAASSSAA